MATLFAFTDIDGDMLAAFTADIPDVGKGINIRTSKNGCSIPDEVAVKMAAAILRKVVGEAYESPEELAAEIVRLREESVRAYSQGVEDMRSAAMSALRKSDAAEWLLAGAPAGADAARIVRDVPIAREGAEPLRRCDVGMSAGPCAKPLNHEGRCLPDAPSDAIASRIVEEEQQVQRKILQGATNPALAGLLTGLQRARDIATDTAAAAPAPRDTDLIQQVRALVKRYGAPAIAAEAARQAKHH